MSRVISIDPKNASSTLKELYQKIEKKMGRVPNIFQNMGNSPSVLKGYLSLSEIANQTTLSPELRELIALTVAEANQCHYCLSAHSFIAQNLKIETQKILQARQAHSQDPKTQAILRFTKQVILTQGKVSATETAALKEAGVSDQELVELIFVINLNLFTNYFNHIVDTKNDFPKAPSL